MPNGNKMRVVMVAILKVKSIVSKNSFSIICLICYALIAQMESAPRICDFLCEILRLDSTPRIHDSTPDSTLSKSKNFDIVAKYLFLYYAICVFDMRFCTCENFWDSVLQFVLGCIFRTCRKFWESTDFYLVLSQNFLQIQNLHRNP